MSIDWVFGEDTLVGRWPSSHCVLTTSPFWVLTERERFPVSLPLLRRTPILVGQCPTLTTSFNPNYFLKGPSSKYNPTEGQGLNTQTLEGHSSVHNILLSALDWKYWPLHISSGAKIQELMLFQVLKLSMKSTGWISHVHCYSGGRLVVAMAVLLRFAFPLMTLPGFFSKS